MSREIDERLVAMRFDNQQFEEGVKESLASLAALREGLDLDGAADSFNDVYKASEKYLKFDEPTKSANGFMDSLSRIGQVGKTVFNSFTAPLKAVGNVVNGLYKDMTRLFGLDIAYNLEQSAVKTLRAFTTEPISTGFQEYETKVDSLKTIMTSTRETYEKNLRNIVAEDVHLFEEELGNVRKAAKERYETEKKSLEAEEKKGKITKEEKDNRLKILEAQREEAELAAYDQYHSKAIKLLTYDEDAHRAYVKKSIEELNAYADKTIYNFQEMMKALPTLTNVGVELDAATSMVKGMSNLAAYAGKGSTEATFALRNLGQAMSLGYFQLIDWKTMEQQGLNTRDFVKTAIQMGLKTGTLIERNGKVYAQDMIEKYNKAISEGQAAAAKKKNSSDAEETLRKAKEKAEENLEEVTVDNFRETLRYQWFDKKTIEQAFKVFSGDLTEADLISMGFDPTKDSGLISWFLKVGNDAMTAATQVRSFTKMMDALKEAAQSGWAQSYEYVFGDDAEATKFWTGINTALSKVIDDASEKRNALLKDWSEQTVELETGDSGLFPTIDGKGEESKLISTRDALMIGINSIIAAFDLLRKAVGNAWENVFGKIDGKMLANLTKRFSDFASNFTKKGIRDNLPRITKALEGFFTVLKVVFGTAKDVFAWVGDKVSPIFKWLFDAILKLGEFLGTKLKGAKNLKDVFDIFKSSASGGAKTAIDWFTSIPEKISSKWQSFKEWYNGSTIKTVVDNIWSSILGFFKAPDDAEDGKSGFDRLVEWLIGAYGTLKTKWKEIIDWWNNPDNKLHGVVDNIWSGILGFFKAPEGSEDGKSGFTRMIDWIANAYATLSEKWNEVLAWWDSPDNKVRTTTDNIWLSILGFFKAPDDAEDDKSGFDHLIDWLIWACGTLETKWKEIIDWWNNPDNKLHGVSDNIWSGIVSFFKAPEGVEGGKSGLQGAVSWIQGVWDSIKNWTGWAEISSFVSDSGIGGQVQAGLSKLFETITNLLNPNTVIYPEPLKPIDRTKRIASGGMSDVHYVDFDEKDSIITKFMNFIGRMRADWETAKENIDALVKDIPTKIDNLRSTLSKFFGGDGEDSWDSIFDSAVDDAKGLGEVSLLFSGSSLLSGLGKFFKGTGALEKYIGKATYKSEKEGHTLGGVLSTLVKRVTTPFNDAYTKKGRKSITSWIENFRPFEGATDFKSTSGKIQDFATAAIEFAGALWILIDAFNRVTEMTKDETIDFEKSGLIVAQLSALIGAFELIAGLSTLGSHSYFGSFTGLIGFAFAIEALVKAFKSTIEATSKLTEGQIKEATILIEKMGTMVTVFTGVNNLTMLGEHGSMLGASTGLIGFTFAIKALVDSFKEIITIIADDKFRKHDYDLAISFITQISIIVGAFTAINDLAMLGKHGSMFGAATGLIGFAYAIQAILGTFKDILGITSAKEFDQKAFDSAGNAIGQIALLIGAFTVVNGNFGHSTLGSAAGIIGFAATIQSMITALGRITDAYGKNGKESVSGAIEVLKELTTLINTFSIYKGFGDLLGNIPSAFGINAGNGKSKSGTGLIGFAFAIEAMITAVARIAAIKDQANLTAAATILDKLGWIIDKFQIFTGLKGMFIGAASQLNDKGKLKSPNGASGIIGFVLAISGLVYDLSVLSNIDPAKADKAADILEKMSNMINVFVGIDALRQGATALTGFSGMSGAATNVSKVIDFVAMEGFVGSIILLVDKIIAVSKDSDLDTGKVNDIVPVFDTLGTIITKLTESVGTFELLNSLAGKFGTSDGSGWATGAKAAVNLLEFVGIAGAALWGIGAALKAAGVTDDQLEDVVSTIHSLTPVVTAITGELGALVGGFFGGAAAGFEGEKMNVATAGIDEAVSNLANVTEEDLGKLKTSVAALNAINETLPNRSFWEWITGETKVQTFASNMKALGEGFANFSNQLALVTDWSLFDTAVSSMQTLIKLGSDVIESSSKSAYGDSAYELLRFFSILSGAESSTYTDATTIWSSVGANMVDGLIAGFKSKAEELSTIITNTVDTDPVITPVLDLEKFNRDAAGMRGALLGGISYNLAGANVNNTTTVYLDTVKELIEQHAADIDKINQTMADGLTFIGTMLGSISLNMDGKKVGDIVTPYVDANISVELARYLRQNGLVP